MPDSHGATMYGATWEIWTVQLTSRERVRLVASYFNRGHAVAKIKGLRTGAHKAASELEYRLERRK